MSTVRLFVGGLPDDATADMVSQRFSPFGAVTACELPSCKPESTDGSGRCFGYVDLIPSDERSVTRCITTYSGCSWRGSRLRVQAAKPDPLVRYAQERLAEAASTQLPASTAAAQPAALPKASTSPFTVTAPDSGKAIAVSPNPRKHLFPPGRSQPKSHLNWEPLAAPPGSRKPLQSMAAQMLPGQPLGKRDRAAAALHTATDESEDSDSSDNSDSTAGRASANLASDDGSSELSSDESEESETDSEDGDQPGSWDAETELAFEHMCADMMLPMWPHAQGKATGTLQLQRGASNASEVTSLS